MKKCTLLTLCLLLGLMLPVYAQPKNTLLKKAVQRFARKSSQYNTRQVISSAESFTNAIQSRTIKKRLSPSCRAEMAAQWFKKALWSKDILLPFAQIQAYRKKYGVQDFFENYLTLYYEKYFGPITPNLQEFFAKVNNWQDLQQQKEVLLRLETLAKNRSRYLEEFWPERPQHILRITYLAPTKNLSPETFQPEKLVYTYELPLNPGEKIPVGPQKGLSVILIDGNAWHISGFAAGLDYLPELYRFLITGGDINASLKIIWDKASQSLLISSADGKTHLRIARHEYHQPHSLHLHLYQYVALTFKNADGENIAANTLLNISFPIENESLNPRVPMKDWFITFPMKHFLKDSRVTVTYGKIF